MSLFSIFKTEKTKTLKIGDGLYLLKVPKKYLTEYDDESTLLFYPPGEETITIRVTVLSFERKDGKESHGSDMIIEDAASKQLDYEVLEEGVTLLEIPPKQNREDDTDLIMQFWYVGRENCFIIFSSTTILRYADSIAVAEMKKDLKMIIRSITRP